MNERDVDLLLTQIKTMILNKPVADTLKTPAAELTELQEAISYLADCLSEANVFLKNLSMGNLEAKTPSRHNFLAASLKELHAGLRHLTWQANQVANGDYQQRVSFLGDFSDSFNRMIAQLEERENVLKSQAEALTKSMNLMIAILDGLSSWVIVTEQGTGEVLYSNQSSIKNFYDAKSGQMVCGGASCEFMQRLRDGSETEGESQFEYTCAINGKTLSAKTFSMQWNEKLAFVHFISDVTDVEAEKKQLESLAFIDELTGLCNRRQGLLTLKQLLVNQKEFSICLMDLDGLKPVNDQLGHLEGDAYLVTVTDAMKGLDYGSGTLCRIGGDEFIAILPDCEEAEAVQLMERLDQTLEELRRPYAVSVSWGVLYVLGDAELSPETVLKRVDDKMYAVKKKKRRSGRRGRGTDVRDEPAK
ncbi:MAG: diguanylate cyclase [Oscillospiraceae bacterium]